MRNVTSTTAGSGKGLKNARVSTESAVVRPSAKYQVSAACVVHGDTSAPLGPSTRCSTETAPPGSSTRAAAYSASISSPRRISTSSATGTVRSTVTGSCACSSSGSVVVVVDVVVVPSSSLRSPGGSCEGMFGKIVTVPWSSRSVALATTIEVSARLSASAVPPAQYQVLLRASSGGATGMKPWASRGVSCWSTWSGCSRSWSRSMTQAAVTRPTRITTAGQRASVTSPSPGGGRAPPVVGSA